MLLEIFHIFPWISPHVRGSWWSNEIKLGVSFDELDALEHKYKCNKPLNPLIFDFEIKLCKACMLYLLSRFISIYIYIIFFFREVTCDDVNINFWCLCCLITQVLNCTTLTFVCFSLYHPCACIGSSDKTVKFWDLETFELIGSAGPEVNIRIIQCLIRLWF